jgi:ankyrin repeat protein
MRRRQRSCHASTTKGNSSSRRHVSSAIVSHETVARRLITTSKRAGVELVDVGDMDNRTPLMHAAQYGIRWLVSLLLANGADCNHQDSGGNTALHWALAYGKLQSATILQVNGYVL